MCPKNEQEAKIPTVGVRAVAVVQQNLVSELPGHHSSLSERNTAAMLTGGKAYLNEIQSAGFAKEHGTGNISE